MDLFSLEKWSLNRDLITVFKFSEIIDTEAMSGSQENHLLTGIWEYGCFLGFHCVKGYYMSDDEQLFFLNGRRTSKKELKSPPLWFRGNFFHTSLVADGDYHSKTFFYIDFLTFHFQLTDNVYICGLQYMFTMRNI